MYSMRSKYSQFVNLALYLANFDLQVILSLTFTTFTISRAWNKVTLIHNISKHAAYA
jgi:hypothetical protein